MTLGPNVVVSCAHGNIFVFLDPCISGGELGNLESCDKAFLCQSDS